MNSKKIDLKELLKEKKKIALGGHVRPDGDCIGSVMGLYLYLKQEYPHIHGNSATVYRIWSWNAMIVDM